MLVLYWTNIHMYNLLFVSQHHMLTALYIAVDHILNDFSSFSPFHFLCWCLLSPWECMYLLDVLHAFTLNLQQSITVIHCSRMNILVYVTGIYCCFFQVLYYMPGSLKVIFPRGSVSTFLQKNSIFPSNNVFGCLLSAGVSILRLSQWFHPANAHGTREQVFLPGVTHLSGEVKDLFFKSACIRGKLIQEAHFEKE